MKASLTTTDFKILLSLAIPLVLSGVIEGSVGFFSTMFLAHLGKDALSAGALVAWLFATMMVILWGTLTTVSILVSRKYGEQDKHAISLILRDSLLLSLLIAIPVFLMLWYLPIVFVLLGQTPQIIKLTTAYLHGLAWGVLPDFIGLVLLQFIMGLGHTRTNMFFSLLWVPVNISLNYILIFGKLGSPALGIAGIGWGTTIAYWITTAGLVLYLFSRTIYRDYLSTLFTWSAPVYLNEILMTGLPMGGMYCLELGFFLVLTLFMSFLGNDSLAANQITLQFVGQFTSVVFAIAGAITIRMGHTLGAKDPLSAKKAAFTGVSIAMLFMSFIGLCYWVFPNYLISIDFSLTDSKNTKIIDLAQKFLALAAIFQLFESVRIALYGALRSLEDTRFTFISSIISFWCIPIPLGYLFAVVFNWGGTGAWCGMILGAMVGVIILFKRFKYKMSTVAFS